MTAKQGRMVRCGKAVEQGGLDRRPKVFSFADSINRYLLLLIHFSPI